MAISAKVGARISAQLKKYQGVLAEAQKRDVSESDTVTIITDMLADLFGYDKYKEITSEHSIRGTSVDLAVVVDEKKRFLLEAKAINIELKDQHIKQAVDYAANEGISWVVLSNGVIWRLYCVRFNKPIDKTLVFEIDILSCDCKNDDVIVCFGSLTSEGYSKDSLADLLSEKQTSSKFTIAAILRSEAMVESLRREIRRLSGVRLEPDFLIALLENEVIKRDLIDGDQAAAAVAYVKKLRRAYDKDKASQPVASEPADAPKALVG
jgi:predicted type IV restriction endonuclease